MKNKRTAFAEHQQHPMNDRERERERGTGSQVAKKMVNKKCVQ
jgi:hypothetical protein